MVNDHWIGQILNNRYRIDQLLGQGGMSSVYKAYDPNLRRTVAIKMIHPHLSNNPDFLRRFEEEAASVATLRNENIVQVFDFNKDGDVYYMVLEYLPGETLEETLKRLNAKNQQFNQAEAVHIITQVCDAVHYAHNRGLIHRDIKPANIMLDTHGKAILMDFGIARIVGGQIHTAAGAVVGTALYMSPEQIQGERVDERTDIYSLGVTLFETLSGKPPFEADSAMTLMMMHLNDPVPDICELQPKCVDSLIAIITKALEKKRENRYQSAAEMAAALRMVSAQLANLPTDPDTPKGAGEPTQVITPAVQDPANAELGTPVVPLPGPTETQVSTSIRERPAEEKYMPLPSQGNSGLPAAPKPVRNRRNLFWIGAALIIAILVLAVGVGAVYILSRTGGIAGLQPQPTQSSLVNNSLQTPIIITQVVTLIPTSVTVQSLSAPVTSSTSQTAANPGNLPPTDQPYFVRIDQITIENGRYVAEYTSFGFTEKLGAMNIHFFYNTVPPDQAGVPGKGPWVIFGGPHPFKGYTLASRPVEATQLCALVANADHSVILNSGNCLNLPAQ